jgi:hypothetical protein
MTVRLCTFHFRPRRQGGDHAAEAALAKAPLRGGLHMPLPPAAPAYAVAAAASAATSTRAAAQGKLYTVAIATPRTSQSREKDERSRVLSPFSRGPVDEARASVKKAGGLFFVNVFLEELKLVLCLL